MSAQDESAAHSNTVLGTLVGMERDSWIIRDASGVLRRVFVDDSTDRLGTFARGAAVQLTVIGNRVTKAEVGTNLLSPEMRRQKAQVDLELAKILARASGVVATGVAAPEVENPLAWARIAQARRPIVTNYDGMPITCQFDGKGTTTKNLVSAQATDRQGVVRSLAIDKSIALSGAYAQTTYSEDGQTRLIYGVSAPRPAELASGLRLSAWVPSFLWELYVSVHGGGNVGKPFVEFTGSLWHMQNGTIPIANVGEWTWFSGRYSVEAGFQGCPAEVLDPASFVFFQKNIARASYFGNLFQLRPPDADFTMSVLTDPAVMGRLQQPADNSSYILQSFEIIFQFMLQWSGQYAFTAEAGAMGPLTWLTMVTLYVFRDRIANSPLLAPSPPPPPPPKPPSTNIYTPGGNIVGPTPVYPPPIPTPTCELSCPPDTMCFGDQCVPLGIPMYDWGEQ